MTYTKEEQAMMVANTKQIEAYLRNLMPKVRERIKAEFGDMVSRGRMGERHERKYEIILDSDALYGRSGGLSYTFDECEIYRMTQVYVYEPGFGTDFMGNLIRDWQQVKQTILSKLDKQNETLSAIHNFRI